MLARHARPLLVALLVLAAICLIFGVASQGSADDSPAWCEDNGHLIDSASDVTAYCFTRDGRLLQITH